MRFPLLAALILLLTGAGAHALMSSLACGRNMPTADNSVISTTHNQCVIHGLPKIAQPCQTYTFTVRTSTSAALAAQLVTVFPTTTTSLNTAAAGELSGQGSRALSQQCRAVDKEVASATYTWRAPPPQGAVGEAVTFAALCGQVFAAPRVTIKLAPTTSVLACSPLTEDDDNDKCIIPRPDTRGDPAYDYLMLVLQWPPGVAEDKGMARTRAKCMGDFTVHGLWPSRERDPTTYPHDCRGHQQEEEEDRFNPELLQGELLRDMERYWPSFKQGGTNNQFWAHEWDKHGTCYSANRDHPGQVEYFTHTLQARSQLTVQLQRAVLDKFPPSRTATYVLQDILNELGGGGGGAAVSATCNAQGDLAELVFCYEDDKGHRRRRACPTTLCRSHCGQHVRILPVECVEDATVRLTWIAAATAVLVLLLLATAAAKRRTTSTEELLLGGSSSA